MKKKIKRFLWVFAVIALSSCEEWTPCERILCQRSIMLNDFHSSFNHIPDSTFIEELRLTDSLARCLCTKQYLDATNNESK
jgi:hypothetical protein